MGSPVYKIKPHVGPKSILFYNLQGYDQKINNLEKSIYKFLELKGFNFTFNKVKEAGSKIIYLAYTSYFFGYRYNLLWSETLFSVK